MWSVYFFSVKINLNIIDEEKSSFPSLGCNNTGVRNKNSLIFYIFTVLCTTIHNMTWEIVLGERENVIKIGKELFTCDCFRWFVLCINTDKNVQICYQVSVYTSSAWMYFHDKGEELITVLANLLGSESSHALPNPMWHLTWESCLMQFKLEN